MKKLTALLLAVVMMFSLTGFALAEDITLDVIQLVEKRFQRFKQPLVQVTRNLPVSANAISKAKKSKNPKRVPKSGVLSTSKPPAF